jgi:hypothetical protein
MASLTKMHHLKEKNWTPQHILAVIIVLQACFMIFMAIQGPSASYSDARVDPRKISGGLKSRSGWSQSNFERPGGQSSSRGNVKVVSPMQKAEILQRAKKLKAKVPIATSPSQYKDMIQVKKWEVSTGDFPGALHFHFDQERQEPYFRKEHSRRILSNEKWDNAAKIVLEKVVNKNQVYKPCQYYGDSSVSQMIHVHMDGCFSKGKRRHKGLIAYNTLPFPRLWCGKTIDAHSIQHYFKKEICDEYDPVRVLLQNDKLLGITRFDLRKMPPIVFQRNASDAKIEAVKDCDVPCKFTMDTCDGPDETKLRGHPCLPGISDWTVLGTDFRFKYSMLDPRDAPELYISRKAYRDHQYYATRSFNSEIPLSSFDWEKYGEITPKNDFKKGGQKGLCFIHLQPCTGEIRPGVWAGKIKEALKGNMDSYGPCTFPKLTMTKTNLDLNNYQDRQKLMGQYMFTLVIGQSQTPDYVQDLVWDALQAGSIPVYFGAPNIREHVPPNSVIVGGEYSSREALAEYLDKVMAARTEWKKYHAWRDDESQQHHLEGKYGFLKEKTSSSYCRMCRWAMAAKYGMAWDPATQTLKRPTLDQKFCVSNKDVVKLPFEELWMSDLGMQDIKGAKVCNKFAANQTIVFDDVAVKRSVTTHDNGVIDIMITDLQSLDEKLRVVLRLAFKGLLHNVEGGHILHPHQLLKDEFPDHVPLMSSIAIQDSRTRATIIANWATDVMSPKLDGTVDILIQDLRKLSSAQKSFGKVDKETGFTSRFVKDEVRKIRIILEEVNILRDVASEYSLSPYARVMMMDFLEPLMHFMITG